MSLKFTDIPWLEHRKFGQQGIWIDGTEDKMTFSTASLSQVSQIYRKALSMKQTYDLSVKKSALNDEYPEESFVDLVRGNQTVDRDSICGHWFNLEIREVKRIADAYAEEQAGELKHEYDALQQGYAAVVKVTDEKVRWYEKYNQQMKASNETLQVKNRMLTEDADYWKDLAVKRSNRIQEILQEVADLYKVKYELQDKVKELEEEVDDLNEFCQSKCKRIDELLDQNESLLDQLEQCKYQLSQLQQQTKPDISITEDRIARQQTLITTLQNSLDKERKFNDGLTSDYNELKKQNENLKKTLGIKIESWNS